MSDPSASLCRRGKCAGQADGAWKSPWQVRAQEKLLLDFGYHILFACSHRRFYVMFRHSNPRFSNV
jgi:hypothetical protein